MFPILLREMRSEPKQRPGDAGLLRLDDCRPKDSRPTENDVFKREVESDAIKEN